ncbi:MAG: hypothetical protein M3Z09_00015, partial [Acidobacteriota bacterium]|nr:hypothetical protein [Acidobacteriota bacterium]
PNTLQAGTLSVTSDSSGSLGTFLAIIPFGQDIQIQSPPAPGSTFMLTGSHIASWSGGDPNSMVTVYLISHYETQMRASYCRARVSAGNCALPSFSFPFVMGNQIYTYGSPSQEGELLYQVDPDPLAIPFSAPGLSLGGQATWRIQHSFQGFAIDY